MRKLCSIALALGILAALAVNAYAETILDDYAYTDADGNLQHDFAAYYHALAVDLVKHSGVSVDPENYWSVSPVDGSKVYDYDAFSAKYDSAVDALKKDVTPVESAPAIPDVSDVLETPGSLDEPDPDAEMAPAPDSGAFVVRDMRTNSVEGDSSPGTFKDVVSRIFGSYTPVTSAETVTETVDGETVTTIIDVVAPGAAGVDYVWLSGVLLFALMLFCLFKLLGGIIS